MTQKTSKVDTHSYKGWLNSDSFLKRAFAITGYQTVAGLLVYAVLLVVVFVFILLLIFTKTYSHDLSLSPYLYTDTKQAQTHKISCLL